MSSNSWVFEEARKLKERAEKNPPAKGYVLFETGYGPSGLPHIGTFAEVFRTTLVRRAFERICDIPTKLFAFSDDMDGLRKVPDNVPNQTMVSEHLGKPLTAIPDPFETHESFGAHMNARLRAFLDQFGFDYEFKSSTECYQSGMFDDALLAVLKNYDAVMKVILPTLGEERQATYSPFLPVSPSTGKVLQVPMKAMDVDAGTVTFDDEDGSEVTQPVTGGHAKLQWKPDWGMRWAALGVDYEMHGKDLTPSVVLSTQICKIIGTPPPLTYVYEMFLDEKGEKISKSKGNGLSLEEWLTYGTDKGLANYLYANPRKARRLHFDVIPKSEDEYISHLGKLGQQEGKDVLNNPAWHIHEGAVNAEDVPVSYGLLLNLASASSPEDASLMWKFISQYAPGATPENNPHLDALVHRAVNYYNDFVKPNKQYRAPTDAERAALQELKETLENMGDDTPAEDYQTAVFTVGKNHNYENLREWFKAIYEVLFGQETGPRMGSFIALYGRANTIEMIARALS